jgi:putative endonuclease
MQRRRTKRRHAIYSCGKAGEDAAVDYLVRKGYRIVERNFRFERGKIDIVAEDGGVLVFVEAKARRSLAFGEPEDAVTPAKRRQILKVAQGYLMQHSIEDRECRFDIITVRSEKNSVTLGHLTNIF